MVVLLALPVSIVGLLLATGYMYLKTRSLESRIGQNYSAMGWSFRLMAIALALITARVLPRFTEIESMELRRRLRSTPLVRSAFRPLSRWTWPRGCPAGWCLCPQATDVMVAAGPVTPGLLCQQLGSLSRSQIL